MPAPASFDYAILRVVPRVERQEFINAGVVVFCLEKRYLERAHPARSRTAARRCGRKWMWTWCASISRPFARICAGDPAGGPDREAVPARALPLADFAAQHHHSASPVHTGVCD